MPAVNPDKPGEFSLSPATLALLAEHFALAILSAFVPIGFTFKTEFTMRSRPSSQKPSATSRSAKEPDKESPTAP